VALNFGEETNDQRSFTYFAYWIGIGHLIGTSIYLVMILFDFSTISASGSLGTAVNNHF